MRRDKRHRYERQDVKRHSLQRRLLEYRIVRHQVRAHKERFIARLQGLVHNEGRCIVFLGTRTKDGYGRMNFVREGKHVSIHVHRLFLILKLRRPIKPGYDAGHEKDCPNKHCVLHVYEQRAVENGRESGAKAHGPSVPF